jgi:hypothetical protein
VVWVTEPFDCSPSRYLLSALFSGRERIDIISLMPASARSYALEFLFEYAALRAFVSE